MARPESIPKLHELEEAINQHRILLESENVDVTQEKKIIEKLAGHLSGKKFALSIKKIFFSSVFLQCSKSGLIFDPVPFPRHTRAPRNSVKVHPYPAGSRILS